MNRGVEKRDIFLDDDDRRTFISLLAAAAPRFNWNLHSYVLMKNHFHLLVETIEPTLSEGVKRITGDYAESFNEKYERVGHLFQGRFRSHLIDSETYLLTVARYIVLNPVRAGFISCPADWPWCSYRATAGLDERPEWLTTISILNRFDPHDVENARVEYRRFVGDTAAAANCPWDDLVGQLCLGSEEFIARVQERIDERARSSEHPREQRSLRCATLNEVEDAILEITGERSCKSASREARMAFVELGRSETRASLREVGVALGIGATGVRYLERAAKERSCDARFRELVERLRFQIRNCKLQT